ncbi:MAG: glycosyltransferase [Pyrinomonadaceae bacterium]|nr:glycosyltransferase [Pyrinomonadaceae bacterium]
MSSSIQAVFYGDPDQYPPIINGSRLLAEAGFELDIFCRWNARRWNVSYPAAVRIHRIKTETGSTWREYLSFVRKVVQSGDSGAAVFIGHDMHGLLPARLLGGRYRRPVIYHCHDFSEKDRKIPAGSELVRLFERRFASGVDLVVVPDAERGAVIEEELGLKQSPLVVANAPMRRAAKRTGALHAALMRHGKTFSRVLFRQGRIGPGHAIESTLQSILDWDNPEWGFVLMGPGEQAYVQTLWTTAKSLGVERQFVVLPPVGYDEVAQFTGGADCGHGLYQPVTLNHRFYTTASNKIMEYMAEGLPLLLSDTPSLKALVNRHECGLTANEESPKSIAAAVNTLLGDQEKSRQMGTAARRAFELEFSYEQQFAPVIESIKKLANHKPETGP